jgi:hypothetical protein
VLGAAYLKLPLIPQILTNPYPFNISNYMKKYSYVLLVGILMLCSMGVMAQSKGSVRGRILDSLDKTFVPGATISFQRIPDSTVVGFTMSDDNGFFEYKGLAVGEYKVIVKMIGSAVLRKSFAITNEKLEVNLGNLELLPESIEGIVVKGEVAPVEIKQDTVEFNAAAFKTKPNANTEDLLKKLPGVEVAKDGSVKAQGEQVRRILVDGKPFFGDDPKAATKNIRADMIDRIQVIDQLSEQSQFTGVDDGNREKVINITTKKDMKKGTFGRALAGIGTDDRYEGNLSLNRFNNDQQISLIASANNINQQSFTLGNAIGAGGGNFRGGFQRIAQAFTGANTNNNNGITTVWSAGLNFNDEWGKKWKINGNYFFNNSELLVSQKTKRQNILPDTTFFTFQDNDNTTRTNNHRLNFRIDYQIDSLTSLRIIPNVSITQSKYDNLSVSRTLSNEQRLLNDANTLNLSDNTQINYSNQLLFRKRFKKRGRAFSANLNVSGSTTEGTDFNTALNNFYRNDTINFSRNIRQRATQDNSNFNFRGGVSYTEPINRKRSLETNYTFGNVNNLTDRRVFDFDEVGQDFSIPNPQLTNDFDNKFFSNRLGMNLITNKLKYSYTIGFAAQYATQNNQDITRDTSFRREFINLFPSAQFRYNFGKNRRMRIDYQGSTNQPTNAQLQPVPDNSNPLNITIGNPDLKQEIVNNIRANFVSFNTTKFSSFFAFLNVGNTANKIVNSTTITPFGAQINEFRNTNGIWNAIAFLGAGIPLQGNSLTLGLNTNLLFNRNKSFINNAENTSDNYSLGQGARITWNYKEKLDFNLSGNVNYSIAQYSLQPQNNVNFFTSTIVADITYTFNNGLILGTEVDYFSNSGLADGFNQNFTIWNASISKQVFKNKSGEIKLRVYDGFRQNVGISRTTAETYIQDVSNVVLSRYYMVSFTYNINRFAAQRQEQERQNRMIFGR